MICFAFVNGQPEASFSIALFYLDSAIRGLEPKGPIVLWPLGMWKDGYMNGGIYIVSLLYSHSHPPRMTDFISHAQESLLKVPYTAVILIELWRVESSHRGLLCLHLSIQNDSASVHDIEIHPLRRCRQRVSYMHDISYKI